MINHNIVVVGGKEYKAVKDKNLESCDECVFGIKNIQCSEFECEGKARSDKQDVIFKPHYRPKASELKW